MPVQHHPAATYVDDLIAHAADLNRQAAEALDAGREDEAYMLIEQVELLARDITLCVNEFERDQDRALGSRVLSQSRRKRKRKTNAIGVGIGASLAAGALLVEI